LKGLIQELNLNIAQLQMPLDPAVTPQKFQANLQTVVKDTNDKAAAANVQLPEKFALGFEGYLSTPPVPASAPGLDRQLKAVQFVIDQLLDGSGVTSISPVVRGTLPEEDPKGKPSTAPVMRVPVKITFVTNWVKLRTVLNNLNQTKKQFYIVHLIDIDPPTGEEKQLLSKPDAIRNRTDKDGHLKPAFGGEKIQVTLSLEIVNFNLPPK
ncbi:MAG TPA: Amuc_1100 family pilus-like protein, partial [Chthoniobacteraceae bacterium]|nr:Amuc_1100 family pilus-like protein [Chthoniobacteraceae bacterium]